MRQLVFLDDDQDEVDNMAKLVEGKYEYLGLHWPQQRPENLPGDPPDIFVLDLYLPPLNRQAVDAIPTEERRDQAVLALDVAERLSESLHST